MKALSPSQTRYLTELPKFVRDRECARAIGIAHTTITRWKSEGKRGEHPFWEEYQRVVNARTTALAETTPESVRKRLTPLAGRRMEDILNIVITPKSQPAAIAQVRQAATDVLIADGTLKPETSNSFTDLMNEFLKTRKRGKPQWKIQEPAVLGEFRELPEPSSGSPQ